MEVVGGAQAKAPKQEGLHMIPGKQLVWLEDWERAGDRAGGCHSCSTAQPGAHGTFYRAGKRRFTVVLWKEVCR